MISKVFNKIREYFQNGFKVTNPGLTILLNWPDPRRRINFPYMTILNVSQTHIHYPQEYVETYNKKSIYNLGEWRCRVNFHYFASVKADLNPFIDTFTNFFRTKAQDTIASRNLIIPFGTRYYENTTLTLLNYEIDQQSFPLQEGSGRRVIFETMASFPDLVEEQIPIMTDPKLDERSEVSEKTIVNPV